MKPIHHIFHLTFSAFCASIAFTDLGEAIPNILMLVNVALFPFVIDKKDFQKLEKHLVYTFLAFIILVLIGTFLFTRWEDFKFISRLILIPIIITLSLPITNHQFPILGFLMGTLGIAIFSSINLINFYLETGSFNFSVGSEINEILLGDRPYLGFLYVISVLLCIHLLRIYKSIYIKFFLGLLALFFIFILFIVSARLSILTLILLLLSSFFYIKNKMKVILTIMSLVLVIPTLLYFNTNMKNRFFMGFKQEEASISKAMKMEPRYHIWDCYTNLGWNKTVPLLGFGYVQTEEKLVNCYKESSGFLNIDQKKWFVESKFNTHNQFFNFHLASGLFAALAFIGFFWKWFEKSRKTFIRFGLFLTVFLFCVLENVLSRQMGTMMFAIVLVFDLFVKQNQAK